MGYTHYWSYNGREKTIPVEAVSHIRALAETAYRAGLIQRDYDDPSKPTINRHEVRFNGVREGIHETFYFAPDDRLSFHFCKTARKPYDEIVMKVLLILGHYLDGLEISSDGEFEVEWAEAIRWFNAHVGTAYISRKLAFHHPMPDPSLQPILSLV
jgi:hypothetical protein